MQPATLPSFAIDPSAIYFAQNQSPASGSYPLTRYITVTAPRTDAIKTETQIFRQMWIAMEGDEYLSVILVGKGDRASQVLSAWKQVRKGFVMHDVTALRKARQKASDQAHAFLVKTASAELLSKSICVEPQWFLIHDGEQRLGWLRIQGRQTTRQKEEGFELGIWMMTQQPADAKGNAQPPRLVYRNMFTNADRSFEMWTTRIQMPRNASARRPSICDLV